MINIGDHPAHDFTDPLGMLSDCHRRIERFLSLLITITVESAGSRLTSAQAEALRLALQYFREAAPKHTADEEDSLFPRLRACEHARARAALSEMEKLHQDHERAAVQHTDVDRLGGEWLRDGRLSPRDADRLAELLHDLAATYRQHIAHEDSVVFPLARTVLPQPALAEVGREMARRRGLNPDTNRTDNDHSRLPTER
jgi:hemerythrin-like domain-containing protein